MQITDNSAIADAIFGSGSNRSAQLNNLALRELDKGLTQFTSKNYELAITSFKRAIRLSPGGDTAVNAFDYMARAQLSQGDTDAAIASYQKALKIAPKRDDLHAQLGNIYTAEGRLDEARGEYELAVKYNPDAANRYSLGQGYLATDRLDEAKAQFEQVKQLAPKEAFGNFGLGQAYAKQGKYDAAIDAFKSAIAIKPDYWGAFSEMGYALADSGDVAQAQDVADNLLANDETLSNDLSQYIYEKTNPKMTAVYASELYPMFPATLGPGTLVAGLNSYLATASAEKTLSMVFQFSKQMNAASVENVFNWSIQRATGSGRGDGYNLDMTLKDTEISLPPVPLAVYYDQKEQTATVLFKVRQNDSANGTIDPSHINFSFSGKDMLGLAMDKKADTYSGFSRFV
jgi:tetratricopeptide (TPR) repeat protein